MNFEEWPSLLRVYWADFKWSIAFFIFFAYIIVDVLYVLYTLAVNRFQAGLAATAGSFMYLIFASGAVNYVLNPLYIIPLFFGAWIGTYFAVEWKRKRRKPEQKNNITPTE